jgi:predicted metal-dependent hydrolase
MQLGLPFSTHTEPPRPRAQSGVPPGIQHAAPGTEHAPGAQNPAPRTPNSAPRTQHPALEPGTPNPELRTENPALSTQNPAPDVRLSPPNTLSFRDIAFVRHPRARRYVIRVRSDGAVRVTIPRGGSKRAGQEFVAEQRRWIEKARRRVARENATPAEVLAPEVVHELRARAKRELPPRLLELAAKHGLRVARISIRNQRSRWGSCSRSAHICLNWRLVQMPPEVRDYVMIHELMHLRRMDHSPTFWKFVEAACPGYQAARRWLRDRARHRH